MKLEITVKSGQIYNAIYEKLREVARTHRLITYGEVAEVIGLDWQKNFGKCRQIPRVLEKICTTENEHGRPMLSAVVVRKDAGIPGAGFFVVASDLKRFRGTDTKSFWQSERDRVWDYWSSH